MKHCYDCGHEKPLSDFYKNASKPDGLTPACKECHRAWRKDHYRRNFERVNKKNAQWNEANQEAIRVWRNKRQNAAYSAKSATGIFNIYHLVKVAIRHGILTPERCRICNSVDVVAHHEDYKKPLDVLWYCHRHHLRLHAITGSRMHTLNNGHPQNPVRTDGCLLQDKP